ncbi:retrovirus-related pol polyprotein from transposon TNT 1-94, partial [Tanacetum coccineum]
MKLEPPRETPIHKVETFAKKVKKRIIEDQVNGEKLLKKLESEPVNTTLVKDIRKTPEYTRHLQELVSNKTMIEELFMQCSCGFRGNNSVMPFSMFKRLGLRNPNPVNMVIEMVDTSMQSPKGIVENVLVKIHKFIFPVDFVILDIIEDDKVPIILGRPKLATTQARIDVFGGKSRPEYLEELLMNDDINGDLGTFLHVGEFQDSDENMGIGIDDFIAIDDLWDDLDPGALTNEQP